MSRCLEMALEMTRPLVLIPTEMELAVLRSCCRRLFANGDVTVDICGFGPIASTVKTSLLLDRHAPTHVFLLGIAGTYNERLAVTSAYCFAQVACYGVGAGTGDRHHTGEELGWSPAEQATVELTLPAALAAHETAGMLLTACAASADGRDVGWKLAKFPTAEAEDMEGYGVASVCSANNIPCTVVRGISNHCGDRDQKNWQTEKALAAVGDLTERLLADFDSTKRLDGQRS